MTQEAITTVIDYTQHIADHTHDFTGREWVFKDINTWLAQPTGPRFFILTGEPGSGKTAVASRLYQFSQAVATPPANYDSLRPNFLSAAHFCWARDLRWIDPFVFTGSLATQLANRDPIYRQILEQKLEEKREGRQSRIEVKQIVQSVVGGQVIGVVVNAGGRSPMDAFNRAVREPLEALFQRQPSHEQVVILVDALDEGLLKKEGEFDIVSLLTHIDYLSPGVRFIVTTRPEAEVLQALQGLQSEPVQLSLTSEAELARSLDDVKSYVLTILNKTPQLADKLAADLSLEDFATVVQGKSEGNFLYVDYLLQTLRARPGKINQEAITELPEGLDKIYIAFLKRLVGKRSWTPFAHVLGTLAVAKEAVTEEQLVRFAAIEEDRVRLVLHSMRQFLEIDDTLPASQRTYAIYHRSFADFLLDKDKAERYWCEEADQHLRIATYYLKKLSEDE